MRRLLIFMILSCASVLSLQASAGDEQDWRRHDEHHVLKVFDAQGKLVGPLGAYSGYDGVFLKIDGALVFAQITRLNTNSEAYDSAKFQWSTYGPFDYTTANCSGGPIIYPYTGPRPSIAMRTGADVTLYIAGETDSSPHVVVAELQGTQCSPPPSIGHQPPSTAPVAAFSAETNYPLTAHYPEPLTIRY